MHRLTTTTFVRLRSGTRTTGLLGCVLLALGGCGPTGEENARDTGTDDDKGSLRKVPCAQRLSEEDCAVPYDDPDPPSEGFDDYCEWVMVTPVDRDGAGMCSFGEPEGKCLGFSPNLDGCYSFGPSGCADADFNVGLLTTDREYLFEASECNAVADAEACHEDDPTDPASCGCACEFAAR